MKNKKTIIVNGHLFEMKLVDEVDTYFGNGKIYDLFYGNKKIAKRVASVKSCYNEAYLYSLKMQSGY